MTIKFGREYQLIIGRPTKLTKFIIPKSIVSPRIIDQGPPQTDDNGDVIDWNHIPSRWYEINTELNGIGLDMTANIKQTKDVGPPCTISFRNGQKELVNNLRKDDLVILRAGYRQVGGNYIEAQGVGVGRVTLPDIFVGQVVQVINKWEGVDRVTELLCSEGATVRKNSKFSYSWPPMTSRLTILQDMIGMLKSQGIPLGRLQLPDDGTYERINLDKQYFDGFTAVGYLMDYFEKYCASVKMRCFTASGKLYVEPLTNSGQIPLASKKVVPSVQIFKIKPYNVKGKVQPISDNVGIQSNANALNGNTGITLRLHLEGQITTDKIISLEGFEEDYDGDYYVTSVNHVLDYRSMDTWDTIVTANRA